MHLTMGRAPLLRKRRVVQRYLMMYTWANQHNGKIGWELGSFLSLAGAGGFGVVAETPRSWSRSRIWLCMTAPSATDALLT